MSYLCRIGLALAFSALAIGPPVRGHAAAQDRVYVAVTDNKGKPIAGLTAADFKIEIDGTDQEILSVAPATDPVSVVIITDRLGLDPAYSIFVVHSALSKFVKGVHSALPDSQFALTTFDGPVARLAGFSSPTGAFDRTIGRLSTNASDGQMLDALVDACRVLKGAPTERRAIFAVFAGYRPDTSVEWSESSGLALWESKASLWAIEVQSGSIAAGSARREQVVDRGTEMSGGMLDRVGSAVGLEAIRAAHGRAPREAVRDYLRARRRWRHREPAKGQRRQDRPARPRPNLGAEIASSFQLLSVSAPAFSYFFSFAPASWPIAASVVCAAFSPSLKSLSV